ETLLVDWGLAVAVDGQPGALSELPITSSPHLDTDGEIVGTPRYMSPEQARGDASARSPRSDVWSLGAVLFELLTGEVPHEEGTSMNILQRAQSQPPPPVRSVAPGVPPDLAAICDKALASEPADRYPTARELAEEVRAFIAGERVRAYDYTPWEVIRRFVGQRPALAAVSALLLLTVVGSAGLNYRAYLRAEASRQAAERDAATAQTTIDFLVDIFELADPEQARGRSITAREILETGARRVEEQLAGQPEVRARLISTIGVVYRNLGLLHEAVPLLEDGLASARKQGDRHELARRLEALAQARMGLQEPKVAVALLEEALRLREELFGPHAVELLPSLTGLMACVGQLDQNQALARDLSERALAIVEASPSTRSAQVAEALTEIGVMLFMLNRRQEASEVKARSLNIYRELYPRGHPDVAVALHNYATSLVYSFRIDQAVPIFEESMAMAQRMLGPDSLVRGESLNSLGEVYWQRGEHDRATKLMEEARGIFERLMGVESQPYLNATQNLGRVLNSMGRFQDAQELLQATFEVVRRNFPDRPLMHGEYLEVLSQVATRLGEAERGEQLAREGLTLVEPAVDPTHWRLARMRVALGSALGGQGRWSEAEAVFLRAHRDAQWKGRTAKYLSYLYEQLDRPREKEAYDAIMKKFDIPRSPNPLFGPVP
ncbi:MAG: tetratricopeptide repeat-containing protein kinase family protein, partial [Myxococcota bacterium]